MPIDHDLQCHGIGPAHHPIEQLGLEPLSPPDKQFRADVLIKRFGVEHQTVEIEHDGCALSQNVGRQHLLNGCSNSHSENAATVHELTRVGLIDRGCETMSVGRSAAPKVRPERV
jgi:hypothetical protein